MTEKRNIDFTQGSILGNLVLFTVPVLLAELLQTLYTTVDSIVVGNFVGSVALAAVSVCSVVSHLIVGFFMGVSVASSVVVSRFFGAGDHERVGAGMRNTFAFSVLLGAALSISGIVMTPWLIRVIGVPAEVVPDAVTYLRIYLAGVLFTVIYNVAAGLLRAVGDSRGTFHILMVVCLLNVALDLAFVAFFGWGVAGVSIATVISQLTAVVIVYFRLKRHHEAFFLTFAELRREWAMILEMLRIGLPAGLQVSLTLVSNMFVWRYISSFGAASMAGVGAAARVERFLSMPLKSFGLAVTTFVGQNVGAGNRDRLKRGFPNTLFLSMVYCLSLSILLYAAAESCVRLFSGDADVIRVGVDAMRVMLPFYVMMALRDVCLGVLRGFGDTAVPMVLSVLGMVGLRQLYLALALTFDRDILHIYIGFPLAWSVTSVMITVYFFMRKSRLENSVRPGKGAADVPACAD